MTREQFAVLVKTMKAIYADPRFIPDEDAFNIWFAMMGDMDYSVACAALQEHINTSSHSPMVVDFRRYAAKSSGQLNAEEAWALVTKAIRNGIYGAEEEYEKLPKAVQKAVGSPVNLREWAQLEKDDVQGVQKSHFVRAYRVEAERIDKQNMLPGKGSEAIELKDRPTDRASI